MPDVVDESAESGSFPRRPRGRTRRDVLRILAAGGAVGALWKLGALGKGAAPVTRSRLLMGTGVHLTVLGADRDACEAAADAALGRMAALEALLSRHREDSEVSRLNATGRLAGASDALVDLLGRAERISRLGEGAFDVTVQPVLDLYRTAGGPWPEPPAAEAIGAALERVDHREVHVRGTTVELGRPGMCVTLDGIGKGYVVDAGVAALTERGFPSVLVEAGGDLMARGSRTGQRPWRIAIRHPRPSRDRPPRLLVVDRAVATSGDYMQPFAPDYSRHHIIDPRSGRSAPELASSTVVAPDAATADALSTLTLVLGSRLGRELIEELEGCEGYFVDKQLQVTRTGGFRLA